MSWRHEVAVIIPCCNQARTLQRAIESAWEAGAYEIIAIDDASPDNTDSILMSQISPRFNYVTGKYPSGGICWARNIGIAAAKSDLILPLDADDELLPGAIDELLHYYSPSKAVYGDYVVNDAQIANANPAMIYRKSVCHATVLFSKEDWRRVGGYKPEFNVGCEDWEFMLSLADAGVKLIHINTPIYRKMINANGRGAKCLERRPLIASLLKEFHPKVQL